MIARSSSSSAVARDDASSCGSSATRRIFASLEPDEHLQVQPTHVDLVAAHREARRGRERVMVVVQLFARDEDADRPQVRRRVVGLEIPVTLRMAEAVDDARGHERHVRELQRDHDDARNAEQHEVGDDQQRDTEIAARRMVVEIVLEPVVRRALRVLLERFTVARGEAIQLPAFEQHALQAEQARAVRIAVLLAMRVMLAVHGDPLARRRARVQPQPEAADVADRRDAGRPSDALGRDGSRASRPSSFRAATAT